MKMKILNTPVAESGFTINSANRLVNENNNYNFNLQK